MGAVDLFADIVGQVEDGRCASGAEHTVVDGLDHPTNFLCEGQVGGWGEGEVGDVKGRRRGARIIGVQTRHVIAGIGLDEDAPVGCGGRPAVGPGEGWCTVGFEGVRGCVPNDGTG